MIPGSFLADCLRLRENFEAFGFDLTGGDMAKLDALEQPVRFPAAFPADFPIGFRLFSG